MSPASEPLRRWSRRADLLLSWGEVGVYFLAALILMVGGGVLAVEAVTTFVAQIGDGQPMLSAATEVLSILLLVFVFVELLGAVRSIAKAPRGGRRSDQHGRLVPAGPPQASGA